MRMPKDLRSEILASFAQDAAAVEALRGFTESAWRRDLEWLDASGLALYLLDHLQSLGREGVLPDAIQARLRQNLADNRIRTNAMLAEATEIDRRFVAAGIACANLKGVTLSPESVPDASLRLQLDLDLLILDADAEKARAVLEGMGYALACRSGRTWEFKAGGSTLPSLNDLYKAKPQRGVELHLCQPNGLLERIARREFRGVALPALSSVDLYLMQAEHLFKHLCGASTRAAWVLEARRHIAWRAGDAAFWQRVGQSLEGEPRRALAVAVVALLVRQVFGDALPQYLSGLVETHVSAGVRLWVERYGRRVLLSGAHGSKHYLLLLAALPEFAAPERGSAVRSILPHRLPAMIVRGFAGETLRSRCGRCLIQVQFLADRLSFHLVEGFRVLLESFRFRRALAGVGR